MNWQSLFFSAEGRIGQAQFWMAVLILLVVWFFALALHVFAPLIWLVVAYCWVCVFAKRLHDFGKSGWLMLLPVAVWTIALTLGMIFGGITAISGLITAFTAGLHPASWAMLIGALGTMFAMFALAALVKFIFLLWVGLSPGDPGENRFGPPHGALPRPAATA